MNVVCRCLSGLLLLCVPLARLHAGGSGLNVLIVVNQASTNSVQLGNYYSEQRQVPAQNFLRISWPGGNVEWTESDFQNYLYQPLVTALATRQLTNQIDYVVLSMDIPYRVTSGIIKPNSTTSALFYGFQSDTNTDPQQCSLALTSTNLYAGSEGVFRSTPPISPGSNSFLVTMITHSNLALAKQIVDRGVLSDATFPTQTVYLAKSTDFARNVRFLTADNSVFNTRLRGNYSMQRTNTNYNWIFGNCLGLQQGVYYSNPLGTTFVPGAMADDLTSFGGGIFEDVFGQLKLLEYLTAGAAGSYGTVTEPCNYLEKFPSPQNYFYQSRGFSLAESYYQSLTNPYQGLIVGEPLAAPFAKPPSAAWSNLPSNALLTGTTNLSLQMTAADPLRPLQQVDLFLDGLWTRTLTNIPPTLGNLLTATINGQPINYAVPAGATIKSVTSGLTSNINAFTATTKVIAFDHGDRIELQSLDRTKRGAQVTVGTSSSAGAGAAATTWLTASQPTCLDTIASGLRNFQITGPTNPVPGSFVQLTVTKTNGAQTTVSVTNTSGTLTLLDLVPQLVDLVNGSPQLDGTDGLTAQDLIQDLTTPFQFMEFNLVANSIGWDAAQISVSLITSFTNSPTGAVTLEDNLNDLRPRDHLYVAAGVTNLPLTFAFNTTTQANGFHQLTAVVYEGTHVRTQQRATQNIQIQNGPLSASFTVLVGDTNSALEATLQFSIVANTNNISRIELFSTGGSLGVVTGQASALFSVGATNLGLGLHPFYALVTASTGQQFRTDTKWLRIVGSQGSFPVLISSPPLTLSWPAAAGRSYDVLSASNLNTAFQVQATVVPTNSAGRWTDTNGGAFARFYRIRAAN